MGSSLDDRSEGVRRIPPARPLPDAALPLPYLPGSSPPCPPSRSCALFLFDASSRLLHGVYECVGEPALNIVPAYGKRAAHDGGSGSPFPAQVAFRPVHQFPPVDERRFCHLLTYVPKTNTFRQKLNGERNVHALIDVLADPAAAPYASRLPWASNGYVDDARRNDGGSPRAVSQSRQWSTRSES